MPLVLWSDDSERTQDQPINVDFFVHRPPYVPILVLVTSIFVGYFMTRWKSNRDAADASLKRTRQLLNAPALDLERCVLQPVVQMRADVESIQGAMEHERSGLVRKLLMSPGVTEEMNRRLDLIDKRVPMIDRLGVLWEAWRQEGNQIVAHRIRKFLREVVDKMSEQMHSDGEFNAALGEQLTLVESLHDRDRLQAAYIERLMEQISRLLHPLSTDGYSIEVKGDLRESLKGIDDKALKELPVAMKGLKDLVTECKPPCQVPKHVDAALQGWEKGWENRNSSDLTNLLDAKSTLATTLVQYSDNLEKLFTAAEEFAEQRDKDVWRMMMTLGDLGGELEKKDSDSKKKVGEQLKSARNELSKLLRIPVNTLPTSDLDVVRILETRLRKALESPPEDLDSAVELDRNYYIPLKLIHRPGEHRGETAATALINTLRKWLRIVRPAAGKPPQWFVEDVEVNALYEQVDNQVWDELKSVRLQFKEGGPAFGAYQMINLKVIPSADDDAKSGFVVDSYAFKHGFVYRWLIERVKDQTFMHKYVYRWLIERVEDQTVKHKYVYRWLMERFKDQSETGLHPKPLVTREPMVQLYVPWEKSKCKIKVQVYRKESEVDVTDAVEQDPPEKDVEVGRSALRQGNKLLRVQDFLDFALVLGAAATAGYATEQFTAAMHGSYTALFTLFFTGMALQQLRDWTFGGPGSQ